MDVWCMYNVHGHMYGLYGHFLAGSFRLQRKSSLFINIKQNKALSYFMGSGENETFYPNHNMEDSNLFRLYREKFEFFGIFVFSSLS